jgi:transcriptional regulator with XRE-family HTH domain
MSDLDTFGRRLRTFREAAGLSLRALAGTAGLSHQAVDRYERDLSQPSFAVAARLAAALGCTLDALAPQERGEHLPG